MSVENKPDGGTGAPALPAGLSAIIAATRRPAPKAQGSQQGRPKARPIKRNHRTALLIVSAFVLVGVSATAYVVTRPKAPEPSAPQTIVKKAAPAHDKQSGHIIISRTNSEICDRYLFDNVSGQMKPVESRPCSSASKKAEPNIADQVNSFHSSWRGKGGAPGSEAPAPIAPRGGKTP